MTGLVIPRYSAWPPYGGPRVGAGLRHALPRRDTVAPLPTPFPLWRRVPVKSGLLAALRGCGLVRL